jgi:Atypical Arm repeat
MAAEVLEAGGLTKLQVLRQHNDPEIRAGASVILDTYFGDEEEVEIGAGSDSESDASGEADGDNDGVGEPPRQRLRLA